jgi:hypothetical protein
MTQIHQDPHEAAPHPTVTEARQAITTRHIRWMLAISLVLTIAVITGAWIWISAGH